MGRHALVIGGGIGGLAAAIGLRRAGWTVQVFERAPELRAAVVLALMPAVAVVAFLIPPHGEPLFLAVGVGLYLLYREASTS